MDLEDLRLLDAVAAAGSFSRAAARLRYSQPSVSARIAAFERAVGAELFARDSRGARPTAAGERYLGYVRRCLELLEQGARAAAAERADQAVRVGVPASYAPALAGVLTDTTTALGYPLTLRAAHSDQLRAELLDGLLDLVVVTPGPVPLGTTSHHAGASPVLALGRPGESDTPVRRFAIHNWSQDADQVISDLLSHETHRNNISVVSPAAAAISLAIHNGYVAVLPRITAATEIQAGWLQPVNLQLPALTARLDYLYPTRHPRRAELDVIGQAVRAHS
jgi:LysR family transcriptional regulator, pca operon transcriptional activator